MVLLLSVKQTLFVAIDVRKPGNRLAALPYYCTARDAPTIQASVDRELAGVIAVNVPYSHVTERVS